jgi:hypothetical protein
VVVVTCTVVVCNVRVCGGFVMCDNLGNTCTCNYLVLYCFVYVYIFVISFVCTGTE